MARKKVIRSNHGLVSGINALNQFALTVWQWKKWDNKEPRYCPGLTLYNCEGNYRLVKSDEQY